MYAYPLPLRILRLCCFLIGFLFIVSIGGSSVTWGCYAVVVGKDVSADGSVLLGHNEQNGGERILNFRRIPRRRYEEGATVRLRRGGEFAQVEETWAFLWSENPGLAFSDGYLNEWGVAVVSDGCPSREDGYFRLMYRGEIRGGGIGYMLRRLVAERARSAREGVEIAGKLVERFGYVDSGRTYVIADPSEAWLLSVVRGRRWVAQRVPDDRVVLLPNVYIIGEVNLDDNNNFLGSPDLVDYAVERGWYKPEKGNPFNFRETYGKTDVKQPDPRQLRGQQMVVGEIFSWPEGEPLPFSVKPHRKLTVRHVLQILRDRKASICIPQTQEAGVFQLRSEMPKEIGCIYWRTTAEPSVSVLTPWYLGITSTPDCYYRPAEIEAHLSLNYHFSPPAGTFNPDPDLAWWKFMALQETVHKDYDNRIGEVRSGWDDFESRIFDEQAAFEQQTLGLLRTDRDAARERLTEYCRDIALEACHRADELRRQLQTSNGDDSP